MLHKLLPPETTPSYVLQGNPPSIYQTDFISSSPNSSAVVLSSCPISMRSKTLSSSAPRATTPSTTQSTHGSSFPRLSTRSSQPRKPSKLVARAQPQREKRCPGPPRPLPTRRCYSPGTRFAHATYLRMFSPRIQRVRGLAPRLRRSSGARGS